jgi:hypothetical protein
MLEVGSGPCLTLRLSANLPRILPIIQTLFFLNFQLVPPVLVRLFKKKVFRSGHPVAICGSLSFLAAKNSLSHPIVYIDSFV